MIVRELVTRLSYSYDGRGLNQSAKAVSKYTSQSSKQFSTLGSFAAKTMGRSFSAISSAGMKAFAGLERGYNRVSRTISKGFEATIKFHGLDKVEGRVNRLNSGFRNMATLAAGAVGGLTLGGAAKSTLTAGGEFETQMARLTTIFGEQAASSVYKQMQQFAAKTPFEMPDLVEFIASTAGAGFGMTKADGTLDMQKLTALGDLASASGKGLPELSQAMISANRGLANMMDNFVGLAGKVEDGGITTTMFDRTTGKTTTGKIDMESATKQADILDFFVRGGERGGVTGGMERLSQTLPGKLSTLRDAVKNLQTQMYLGFQPSVHQFMDRFSASVEKLTPKAKELGLQFGAFVKNDLPGYLEKARKAIPYVVTGLGLMYAHMLGIKTLQFANVIYRASVALNAMGLSGAVAAGGMALLPLLIGGIVAGIGLLTADIIYFANTGESHLLSFTEKWPGLNDKIRNAYYLVIELAKQVDQGFRSMGELMSMYLPPILDGLKVGFRRTLTPARVTLEIIVGLFKAIGDGIGWAIEQLGRLGNAIANMPGMDTLGRFFGGFEGGHGPNRDRGLTPVSGNASNRILQAGMSFTTGAPGSSMADRWALGQSKQDGLGVKKLFIDGVACAISAEKIVANAGGSQALLNQMTPSVPQTYNNLINSGMAELVPASQLQGGELFFHKNLGHMGVVGPDGKKLIHASNSRGKEIGMGQRLTQTGNYLGAGGYYLRIKDQHLMQQNVPAPSPNRAAGGAGGNTAQVQQVININGPTNPAAAGQAAKRGIEQVFTNNGLMLQP